jgi:transcriptional regulator with GAF, ATPase, and Fis domain
MEVLRFSEVSGVSNSCRVYLEEVGKEFVEKISSNTCQFIEGVHEEKNNNRFIQTDLKYFEDSKLEAFGVFPLFFEGKFIGAIALFFGYKFKLFDNNLSFLQSFSSLLAILVNKQTRAERLRKVESLAEHWINETSHLSSTHEAIIHPSYQRIIGMGQDVIPFLLKNIKETKSLSGRWFWALKAISGEDPVPEDSRGKSQEMIDAWLHWGIQKGYIKGDILMNTKSSI